MINVIKKKKLFFSHDIMLDCWQERPILRPTFTELSERLGMLLEIEVKSVS